MEVSNYTSVIVDSIQAIAAIVVAVVAIWGVNAWRREHVGRRRAELAEETLALFYEAEQAIRSIRSPFGHADEGKSRKRGKDESEEEAKILDDAYVIIERYNANSKLFSRIRAQRFRFMALFGKTKAKPFEDLREIINDFYTSSYAYVLAGRHLLSGVRVDRNKIASDILEAETVFWDGLSKGLNKPDPINPRLEELIQLIENTCRDAIGVRK
jgi:hypothetical protein